MRIGSFRVSTDNTKGDGYLFRYKGIRQIGAIVQAKPQ